MDFGQGQTGGEGEVERGGQKDQRILFIYLLNRELPKGFLIRPNKNKSCPEHLLDLKTLAYIFYLLICPKKAHESFGTNTNYICMELNVYETKNKFLINFSLHLRRNLGPETSQICLAL